MISDRQLASAVGEPLLQVNNLLNEMALHVKYHGADNESRPSCLVIGKVSGNLRSSLANPMCRNRLGNQSVSMVGPYVAPTRYGCIRPSA